MSEPARQAHGTVEPNSLPSLSLPFPPSHNLTLEFQTVSQDGLLLFAQSSPSTRHMQDFLALELRSGRLIYSYNLGGGRAEASTAAMYNDGYLHMVSVLAVCCTNCSSKPNSEVTVGTQDLAIKISSAIIQ